MREIIARPMGTIITAVAVFEIHMDKKADAVMKPSIIVDGLPPIRRIIQSAILLCNRHFSMAIAIIKPPIKRKIVLLM